MGNNAQILVLFSGGTELRDQILRCPGSVRIDGFFQSSIHADGDVFLGSNASVEGLIKANNLHVYGTLKGDVLCKNKVMIYNTGAVKGDIITKFFEIQENGTFIGRFTMRK